MKIAFALALCASAGLASAGFTATEASWDFGIVSPATPAGDTYFHVAGLGGAGGFAIATLGAVDDTFDGAAQAIGAGIVAGTHTGLAETNTFGAPGSTGAITFGLFTDADELAPAGFTVGGLPADTLGVFVGANAGGNPLDSTPGIVVSGAFIELFDAAGSAGVFDITGFGNFTAGAGGTWDGSVGVSFGAGSAGLGIIGYEFAIFGTTLPTPASAALLGLGGLVAVRRRR